MSRSQPLNNSIHYRPEIDGVRAIAVVSVILYHFFPNLVPGGFIGVDIFFVISGYLISSIIINKKNSFSILDFYARRIKRIIPALSLVLITCIIFGWFTLLTDEYKQLGKHVVSSTLFFQNLMLLSESNYFDNSSITKPLLHLWSLGIEEQFYLAWPLIIILCRQSKRKLTTVITTVGTISFVIGLWYLQKGSTSAAYYSPDSRAWELLFGAALASLIKHSPDKKTSYKFDTSLAFGGLILFAIGFNIVDKEKHFPGFYALIPVVATGMIIYAKPENVISKKILSSRIMVAAGLISYPLYLWHWPLISFAWVINGSEPSINIKIALLITAFILAWLTFYYVEKPFRKNSYTKKSIYSLLVILFATSTSGLFIYENKGLPFRKNAELKGYPGDIGHNEFHKYIATNYFPCTPKSISNKALKWNEYTRCMQSKADTNIDIALLGDSHAEHLFIGIAEALKNKNIVFYIEDGSPFVGNPKFARLYDAILSNSHIKTVVLTMYWHGRFGEVPTGNTLGKEIAATAKLFTDAGKKVLITDDVPDFPFSPEKCKGHRWLSFSDSKCSISLAASNAQKQIYLSELQNVANQDKNIKLLPERKYLCNDTGCSMVKNGLLLYRDTHHLNITGSRYIGESIVIDNKAEFN